MEGEYGRRLLAAWCLYWAYPITVNTDCKPSLHYITTPVDVAVHTCVDTLRMGFGRTGSRRRSHVGPRVCYDGYPSSISYVRWW